MSGWGGEREREEERMGAHRCAVDARCLTVGSGSRCCEALGWARVLGNLGSWRLVVFGDLDKDTAFSSGFIMNNFSRILLLYSYNASSLPAFQI